MKPAKPSAGAAAAYQVGPGETLDLSAIANESITLVKLGNRLVVLFEDRGYVVVDGLYLPDGSASQAVQVKLDTASAFNGVQFVAQFPISSDEQVLTAAGISIGPRGAGGINLASAPPSSALQPLNALTLDDQGRGTTFGALPDEGIGTDTDTGFGALASGNPSLQTASATTNDDTTTPPTAPPTTDPAAGPAATLDRAAVTEAGVGLGGAIVGGIPTAGGNLLTNDSGTGLSVTGVGAGTLASVAGGVGTAIAGTYGTLTLAADGTYSYALSNNSAATNALAQGATAQDLFSYTATDSLGRTTTTQLVVTVTGTNDTPLLDLDSTAAGSDYRGTTQVEAARSTKSTEGGFGGVTVVQTDDATPLPVFQHAVSDPDGDRFSQLRLTVDPASTGSSGTIGVLPSFTLPAGTTLSTAGTDYVFASPGMTGDEVRALLAAIRYFNTETTFALDTSDRVIHITVTDAFGAQQTATAYIPVAADVTDTTNLDAFTGTRFDDIINGLGGNNVINAGLGNDRVTAGDGNNIITLGDGNNVAVLGNGDNKVTAGSGNDDITTGSGDDIIDAGGGDDIVRAGDGDNRITTGAGNDTVYSGAQDDSIDAGDGNNTIYGGDGDNTVITGAGNDRIETGSGDDDIRSGAGDDTILAGDGDNLIDAGGGDDIITTGAGDDLIYLGSGNDRITTGDGSDKLTVARFDPASLPTITDFATGVDEFNISHLLAGDGLAELGADTGKLDASRFVSGGGFTNTDQRLLFDTGSSTLYYDADGSGAAAAVALAKLETGTVGANDIRLT